MRFEEAFGDWQKGRLTQEEAARLLGVCDRTFRRYIDRYENEGLDGLMLLTQQILDKFISFLVVTHSEYNDATMEEAQHVAKNIYQKSHSTHPNHNEGNARLVMTTLVQAETLELRMICIYQPSH